MAEPMVGMTYAEMVLELENAIKRQSNTEGRPPAYLRDQLARIAKIREILERSGHLDRVPSHG